MQLNPDTISILKEWKEDETQRHRLDEFIQLEEKDLDLAIDFSVKKYPTKRSKSWGLKVRENKEHWLRYYKGNPFYFVHHLVKQCVHGRHHTSFRSEVREQIEAAFNLKFFEGFDNEVYKPFEKKTNAFDHKELAIERHKDRTKELDEWEFSVAEDFLDLDSKKEEN